jgi:hypothetical protein
MSVHNPQDQQNMIKKLIRVAKLVLICSLLLYYPEKYISGHPGPDNILQKYAASTLLSD